jgi:hypothetical protein
MHAHPDEKVSMSNHWLAVFVALVGCEEALNCTVMGCGGERAPPADG